MVYFTSTIAIAILSFCASYTLAAPVEGKRTSTLSLSRHVKPNASSRDYIEADKARRDYLTNRGVANAPIINAVQVYTTNIQVGNQTFSVLVDTGSSNIWVGSGFHNAYVPTASSVDTGNAFSVTYGSGYAIGEEYLDTVIVGGLQIWSQSIGVTTLGWYDIGFHSFDGICGFGPDGLTWGTVANTDTTPTVMQNLKSQGMISNNVLGVFLHAESGYDQADVNGELTLGGIDSSHFKGSMQYAPISTADLYNNFFSIDVSSITFGSTTIMSTSHPAVMDTGTTFPTLPGAVFDAMMAVGGGGVDTNFPSIFPAFAYFNTMPTENIVFHFNGHSVTLTPAQYMVPPAQAQVLALDTSVLWTYIQRGADDVDGSPSLNFILGQKFFEYIYSVYDTDKQRVGLAPNAY